MSAFTDEDYRRVLNERDEARAEVDHWRVKAEAYGGMVHGCGPVLESAGHPIDPFHPDGRVGGIARSVAALVKERDEALAEVEHAYSEVCETWTKAHAEGFHRGAEAMRLACQQWCRAWENDGEAIADALADLRVEE